MPCDPIYRRKLTVLKRICVNTVMKSCLGVRDLKSLILAFIFFFFPRGFCQDVLLPALLPFLIVRSVTNPSYCCFPCFLKSQSWHAVHPSIFLFVASQVSPNHRSSAPLTNSRRHSKKA